MEYQLKYQTSKFRNSRFLLNGNDLFVQQDNGNLVRHNLRQNKFYTLTVSPLSKPALHLQQIGNDLLTIDGSGNPKIIGIEGDHNIKLDSISDYCLLIGADHSENFCIYNYENKLQGLYDYKVDKIKWLKNIRSAVIYQDKDYLVTIERSSMSGKLSLLRCIEVDAGKELWTVDTSDFGEDTEFMKKGGLIKQIFGIYDGNVICWVTPFVLIGVDVHSGNISWKIQDYTASFSEKPLAILSHLSFSKDEGKIIGFTAGLYFEIDLKGLKCSLLSNLRKGNKGASWNFIHSYVYKNLIYFVGTKEMIITHSNILAVFDRQMLKVSWHQQLNLKGAYFHRPPVANDRWLCVHDSKDMLYVFEREFQ